MTPINFRATSFTVGTSFVANTSLVTIGTTVGLQANGGIGTAGQVLTSNGSTVYWNTPGIDPIVINNISTQFDGYKSVFNLMTDQTPVTTIVDSKDVDVTVNGLRLTPYVDTVTFPWLSPFDQQGEYRVSNNQIIIYDAPAVGDQASIILRQISKTRQKNKYPYSANTISLGV